MKKIMSFVLFKFVEEDWSSKVHPSIAKLLTFESQKQKRKKQMGIG